MATKYCNNENCPYFHESAYGEDSCIKVIDTKKYPPFGYAPVSKITNKTCPFFDEYERLGGAYGNSK